MQKEKSTSRRAIIKSSLFGLLAVSLPNLSFARNIVGMTNGDDDFIVPYSRYPAIDENLVSEVVGVSHFDLDRLKVLVDHRPELARATWDWGFGDWESAIGAASHVGRRDIVQYLMDKGARPTIFTFAMMGSFHAVKQIIEAYPSIQKSTGPHGITLLRHAEIGAMNEDLGQKEKEQSKALVDLLHELGDADITPKSVEMSRKEKEKYLGDYKYGEGEKDGFSIKINMREMLAFGKLGSFGGGLIHQGDNTFLYNGVESVIILFEEKDGKILSLTINEPDLSVTAIKQ